MDVLPSVSEIPATNMMGFTAAETVVVPQAQPTTTSSQLSTLTSTNSPPTVTISEARTGEASSASPPVTMIDNIALPASTKSVIDPANSTPVLAQNTIVTHLSSKSTPMVTVVSTNSGGTPTSSAEAVIQIHNNESATGSSNHRRVALVASQSNPNKVSIIPSDQLDKLELVVDENCINEANKSRPNDLSSGSGGVKSKRRRSSSPPTQPPQRMQNKSDCEQEMTSSGHEDLPEKEEYQIVLKKDVTGLGITIAGYVCEKGKERSVLKSRFRMLRALSCVWNVCGRPLISLLIGFCRKKWSRRTGRYWLLFPYSQLFGCFAQRLAKRVTKLTRGILNHVLFLLLKQTFM